ncbi:hypothetical protein KORDIASMS9_01455 [Kordia sp. SMS9]|uniref:hypothetical protein n=1 Tax=Kordia sp. SMS9 TaxID=2282170 RepID=UPI000E0D113A|nr:hypothetical protein [Kordia sp. SMS9]AXG69235.1 hypothetical protein KORDIASMS9_01455 [Kordia sp. SMS9]
MKWKQQKSNIAIGILFLIAFVVVLRNPAVFFPDSQGYLEMHIIRTPGYPLFLQFAQSIFGDYFETATVTIQILFGCFSIYYFIYKLRSNQVLNDFFSVCLAFVLLLPFITGLKIANNMLSESLSYSLYLIIVAKFIAFFLTKNVKELYMTLPILAVLLITRYQFIFFIPLGLGLIFWVSYVQKSFKKYALISVLFVALPLITSLADKTYHKIIHGHFVSTPWTGMSVITPILFVADAEDATVLETAKEKEFFNNVYQDLAEKQMNSNHLQVPSNDTPTMYYIKNYANIQMGPIFKNGEALLDKTLTKTEKFIALDQFISKVSKPLLFDNFSKWRRLYTGNAIFGFGGFKYALLYFLIALCSCIALLKRDQAIYKIIGLSSLLVIGNVLIVAIGMHAVVRFTFYSDWVLFFTIFVLLNALNKKRYES